MDGKLQWQLEKTFTSPTPAHTYYVTLRVKATDSSFASKPADRLKVTTPDALLIDGPAGAVSFEAKGTYGQTLENIPVKLAEKFQVVNYGRSPVSGTWKFSADPPFIRRYREPLHIRWNLSWMEHRKGSMEIV